MLSFVGCLNDEPRPAHSGDPDLPGLCQPRCQTEDGPQGGTSDCQDRASRGQSQRQCLPGRASMIVEYLGGSRQVLAPFALPG
jgi:hypothetical protein